MPYMPCSNPHCNRYRKTEERYCVECRTNGVLKVLPPDSHKEESKQYRMESVADILKQAGQDLIQQSMDNGVVKPLGELEEYNIYED